MNHATGYDQFQNEDGYKSQLQPQQQTYAPGMVAPTAVVVHNTPGMASFSVERAPVRWSWCHLVTAVFSIWCCTIFGVIATVSSILAYVDHKGKDYERARHKRNMSLGFGIAAIVIGSIVLVVIIIIVATSAELLTQHMQKTEMGGGGLKYPYGN